jgi:hypothetical protein
MLMNRLLLLLALLALTSTGGLLALPAEADAANDIPRTSSGRPDLSGTYDIATLTPLQRPAEFGDNLYMSQEKANEILERNRQFLAKQSAQSEGDREAPPAGGDGSAGASGNVGGYNAFWIDAGDSVILVDGKFRTSRARPAARSSPTCFGPTMALRIGWNGIAPDRTTIPRGS